MDEYLIIYAIWRFITCWVSIALYRLLPRSDTVGVFRCQWTVNTYKHHGYIFPSWPSNRLFNSAPNCKYLNNLFWEARKYWSTKYVQISLKDTLPWPDIKDAGFYFKNFTFEEGSNEYLTLESKSKLTILHKLYKPKTNFTNFYKTSLLCFYSINPFIFPVISYGQLSIM